jgi:hypothetical protein
MHIKEIANLPENLKNEYQDLSSNHNYRTEIPNIIFHLNLTPWEFKAYCVIKQTAGDRGVCFKSNTTLSNEIGCSIPITIDLKKKLVHLNLIKITKRTNEKGGDLPDLIQIKDIWPQNMEYMAKLFPKNPDNDVFKIIDTGINNVKGGGLTTLRGGVNHVKGEGKRGLHKEDHIEEDLKEEDIAFSLSSSDEQQERKIASKKEIEFRNGRFQNISSEQIDSWKRAYPDLNLEAVLAQFESVLTLNPGRIFSKTPWGGRINSWIKAQSQGKEKLKEEVLQSIEPIKQESPKHEPKPRDETNFFYSGYARNLVKEWEEKLGSKGIISFLSNILSLKIFSTNESWHRPIDDKGIVKFMEFIAEKIKQEIQIPQT